MIISLVGMRFYVRVGILPHERVHAQPLEIDLRVTRADDAEGVLDYRGLYGIAAERLAEGSLDYLEDIATSLVERAMSLTGVIAARAAVRKPNVLVGGPLAYAEVIAERGGG
ncbi:MAG: dihydroneopterin aldolase [Gemmatimonadaceae bacterium]